MCVLCELVRYIVYKGLIIVDGISFMVNVVNGVEFELIIVLYMFSEIIMVEY